MGNRLKDFLFPTNNSKELETTTIEVNLNQPTKEVKKENKTMNTTNSSTPNIYLPKAFLEVEDIAIELLNKKSVIVDLNSTDSAIAKRISDFLNGVIYAINGSVKKLSTKMYLFSPDSK